MKRPKPSRREIPDEFFTPDGNTDPNSGRIIIDADTLTLYLQKTIKNNGKGRFGKQIALIPVGLGLFEYSSDVKIYIDQWDLLAQRKPYIPVRRVKLLRRYIWIQTDKDISDIHLCGADIKEFYL